MSYGPLKRFLQALDIPCMKPKTFQEHETHVTSVPDNPNLESKGHSPTEVEIGPFDIVQNIASDSAEAKPLIEIVPMPARQTASTLPAEPSMKVPLVTRSYTRKLTIPEFEPRGKRTAALKKPCKCCNNLEFSCQSKKRKCHVKRETGEEQTRPKTFGRSRRSENFSGVDIYNGITPKMEPCNYESFDHDYLGYNFVENPQTAVTEPSFTFISTCKMEVDPVDDIAVKNESCLFKTNDGELDVNYPVIVNVSSDNVDDSVDGSFKAVTPL